MAFVSDLIVSVAQAVGPTVGVVLVAWLQGRSKGRVKLKIDRIEAEGRSLSEVQALLKHAADVQSISEVSSGRERKQTPHGRHSLAAHPM